jgi:transposase-like protein
VRSSPSQRRVGPLPNRRPHPALAAHLPSHSCSAPVTPSCISRPIAQPLNWPPLAAKVAPFLAARNKLGALLRREGLYSSLLSTWRQQRDEGTLAGLTPKRRGRKANPDAPLIAENQRLMRETQRLAAKLRQAETIIDIQKKLSEMLGIPLPPSDYSGSEP